MSERDIKVLKSIRRYAVKISEFVCECANEKDFINDLKTCSACSLYLIQIGELAKKQLSDEARNLTSDIPWKRIYGLRNRIVHGYEDVNFTMIWDIINNDIPDLIKKISQTLDNVK
ncbi:MAG: DUF86 domain-containing protein [Ruminococcus sp.]|nr:DUF86 domain-containing protein [Ruminococcus sp.]